MFIGKTIPKPTPSFWSVRPASSASTSSEAGDILSKLQRCWYEGNDSIPISDDPLMRNLKPGEVGVAYHPMGRREICSEDDFELLDRTFRPGSVCKRFQEDSMSGIVLNTDVNVRVQHAITYELLDRWVPLDETNPGHELEIGDHIIYNDWVGQVRLFPSPPLPCFPTATSFNSRQIIEVDPFKSQCHDSLMFTSELGSFSTRPSCKQAMATFEGFPTSAHAYRSDTRARFAPTVAPAHRWDSPICIPLGRTRTSSRWQRRHLEADFRARLTKP